MKKLSILVVITFLLSSCAPFSKESYLERYASFMQEIEQNYNDYKPEDWKQKDVEFVKFSRSWRAKFEDEFTLQEELILLKYKVQYELYKAKDNPLRWLEIMKSEDFHKWSQELKNLMNEDLKQEIDTFLKENDFNLKDLDDQIEKIINNISQYSESNKKDE